jgi:hypothetical protein
MDLIHLFNPKITDVLFVSLTAKTKFGTAIFQIGLLKAPGKLVADGLRQGDPESSFCG